MGTRITGTHFGGFCLDGGGVTDLHLLNFQSNLLPKDRRDWVRMVSISPPPQAWCSVLRYA